MTSHATIVVLIQTCRTRFRGQSLLLFLRQSKGLRIYHVRQWLQLARPPPPAQPPFLQCARLQLLKRYMYVHVFACRPSCCVSLESRLVLNSEYSTSFSFFFSALLLSLLIFTADSSSRFKQLCNRSSDNSHCVTLY